MASISQDPNGRRSIQFVASDGRRRTIRLGKISQRLADEIKVKVEALNAAAISGLPVDGETAAWLRKIGDDLAAKLAAVGLVQARVTPGRLAEFLASYKDDRSDVKDGTRTNYGIIGARLMSFFGADCALATITPGDADRFADHLRTEYAAATVAKTIKMARQMFRRAVRLGMLHQNPFDGIKAGSERNASRSFFVSVEATEQIIATCPDLEWRLIIALARYGGLRCPSEILSLTWQDILWDQGRFRVRSPKTEGQGKAERLTPIFPELRPHLEAAFDAATEGATFAITRYRDPSQNLRTQLLRIIRRAGLPPWERLFQNMRSSRETELVERFPVHVVTSWLGNSPRVAEQHYLQTTEDHFQRAMQGAAKSGAEALQNAVQQAAAPSRTASQDLSQVVVPCEAMREDAVLSDLRHDKGMTLTGSELSQYSSRFLDETAQGAAKSGAVDADLARIVSAWPMLPADARSAIMGIVRMALAESTGR